MERREFVPRDASIAHRPVSAHHLQRMAATNRRRCNLPSQRLEATLRWLFHEIRPEYQSSSSGRVQVGLTQLFYYDKESFVIKIICLKDTFEGFFLYKKRYLKFLTRIYTFINDIRKEFRRLI